MILKTFDVSILETFKDLQTSRNTKISGKSLSYNNVEDIWRFKVNSLEIKDDFFKESSNLCNLVARNAENNPIEKTALRDEGRKRSNRGGSNRRQWLGIN